MTSAQFSRNSTWCVAALFLMALQATASPDHTGRYVLKQHLQPVVSRLHAAAAVPATNQLQLAIGLPVKDPAALDAFLKDIYNPSSRNYRQFLSPAQFTERFGPSPDDYQALIQFATRNGLHVSRVSPGRMVLNVSGSVADIEKTFQVRLHYYQHPKEARTFFAPDTEPSVEANLPVRILSVRGLDNYALPKPASLRASPVNQTGNPLPNAGSGPGGLYLGNDFRTAYLPGNKLNGTGQSVALVEFDGYYTNDIASYESLAKLPAVPLTNVRVNGGVGTPGANEIEVALDIEMAIAMATNLSSVIVYEAPNGTPWLTMLTQIADDNSASQISCSWSGGNSGLPDPASEQQFQKMAAQGQSFFTSSGDSDAYAGYVPFPDESPNITVVGGTALSTVTRSGARSSEVVWNTGLDQASGNYIGTGGGISPNYSIPVWQLGINSFLTNGGSRTARNIPDVALTADNVYVRFGNGQSSSVSGTSCAAPLWAGVMALVNQLALATNQPVVGFLNPAIYEIANESIYNTVFFDVTAGSNAWPASPLGYFAVTGYDLCTGLGTPKSPTLLPALVTPDSLVVVSNYGFTAVEAPSGAFNLLSQTYYVTNAGAANLTWSLVNTSGWLSVSTTGGTLAPGAGDSVVVGLNTAASNLIAGTYTASLWFSNVTSKVGHSRLYTLQTSDPLVIQPFNAFTFAGPPGGPFAPDSLQIILTNPSPNGLNWSINSTSAWFNLSPMSGNLAPGSQALVTVTPGGGATNLWDGIYTSTIQITNLNSQFVQAITGIVSVGIVQNGGFETGDFTDWTLVGNGDINGTVYNAVVNSGSLAGGSGPMFIHSGTYGAFLGDTNIATLSQTVTTEPGMSYQLSFWLDNPASGAGQVFGVRWITNGTPNQLYSINNPPALPWTNLVFIVSASGTNATLQFFAENPPDGFGLDDITLDLTAPPVFVSQPANATVLAGTTVVLSGAVRGIGPFNYQWLRSGTNLSNSGNISGATTNVLTFSSAAPANTGIYSLRASNNYGSVTSVVASVEVFAIPAIGNVIANQNGTIGLQLTGTPGATIVVETSTNILAPAAWFPVATNVIDASGIWEFTDASVTHDPQKFYRLRLVQ